MKEQILAQFEVQYKEYEEYKVFLENYSKEKMDGMKDAVAILLEQDPLDLQQAVEFVFDYRGYPNAFAIDLDLHKERLLAAYQLIENTVEIPQEIKTELTELKNSKRKPMFIIKQGKYEVFNKEELDARMSMMKAPEVIKATVDSLRNVQKMQDSAKKE